MMLECYRNCPRDARPASRPRTLLAKYLPAMLLAHFVGDARSREPHELGAVLAYRK
jgi:hypothetical protein